MKKYKSGDKKHLIKLAKKEIKEWSLARDKAIKEIYEWERFIFELENEE